MEYNINKNLKENRFEAILDNKTIGVVDFILTGNTLNIIHTGVLPEYEGNGIAGSLNKALLEYAMKENLKVIPSCSYTKTYIERHSEYKSLL